MTYQRWIWSGLVVLAVGTLAVHFWGVRLRNQFMWRSHVMEISLMGIQTLLQQEVDSRGAIPWRNVKEVTAFLDKKTSWQHGLQIDDLIMAGRDVWDRPLQYTVAPDRSSARLWSTGADGLDQAGLGTCMITIQLPVQATEK